MPKREQQNASPSPGRNESHNSNDQSTLKDEDVTNMLSPGVELIANLVTRVEENLKRNIREVRIHKFLSQHCNVVYFRTPVHVGITPNEQISRDLHQRLSE